MKSHKSLVSIIMPAYNCEEFIHESISSIIHQTYSNWELIIVNDCSRDNTLNICSKYASNDPRISVFENTIQKGAAFSRNFATELASGEYISFLDSDDIWKTDKIEKQLNFMTSNNYDFTYTFYDIFQSNINQTTLIKSPKKINKFNMLFSNPIGCLTVMYNRRSLGKIYSPLFKKRNDYSLWIEILNKSIYGYCLDISLASYRKSDKSLSSGKIENILYYWKIIKNYFSFWYFLALISTPIYLFLLFLKKKIPNLYNKLIRIF